jgi:hypothetical protein
MREYTKKPENQSRTLDSNPRASRQLPIEVVLQKYAANSNNKNGTNNVVQLALDWGIWEYKEFERAIGVKGVPLLIIHNEKVVNSFNCDSPNLYLKKFMILNRVHQKDVRVDDLLDTSGGAAYCPILKCIYILKDHEVKRNVLHELGHAKQHQEFNNAFSQLHKSLIEAHNVIVNENKYPYFSPPTGTEHLYLRTDNLRNDGITISKIDTGIFESDYVYYRVMYNNNQEKNIDTFMNIYKNIDFTEEDLNLFFRNTICNQMYVDMKISIHRIEKSLMGAQYHQLTQQWEEIGSTSITSALRALMNWGIQAQIKVLKNE